MKKALAWATGLSLSIVSPVALAVGLGPANVSSYLNAPLKASMPLLESSDYALEDIRVRVADQADFAIAGLEWTPLAASVSAQVHEQQGGREVRLSSQQPIEEPWLELLFTTEYPGGQQTHDVTLLFDPQGYAQDYVESPVQDHVKSPVQNYVKSPVQELAYVGSGDTLWGVAERIKPVEVSVQQMMVALLEINPEVFPTGNIHDMRADNTLRVPDIERILARSHSDANAAIQAMNEAWGARRNEPLQAVSLPRVETAQVSETSIAATQALQANNIANPAPAPMADSLEADDPEADGLEADGLEADGPAAIEERELMRAEINELRGDVASLTQTLSAVLAAQEQSPTPLAANMGESQSVSALIARFQWPLALAAIALLVALLVWLRKRREETWDDTPFAEPVIKPAVSPNVTPGHGLRSVSEFPPSQQGNAAADQKQQEESDRQSGSEIKGQEETDDVAPKEALPIDTDQWLVGYHPPSSTTPPSAREQAREQAREKAREKAPMQPTVEFATESPPTPAKQPRQPIEEEWEIEEVAFKPRGLDNSKPSKSSK